MRVHRYSPQEIAFAQHEVMMFTPRMSMRESMQEKAFSHKAQIINQSLRKVFKRVYKGRLDADTQRAIITWAQGDPIPSHYMEDIERLCERIIIIREGELVYDGNLQRVIHEYAPYKQLTVHLNRAETAEVDKGYLDRIGEVMEEKAGTIILRIPRDQVASAAAEILRKFSVQDLSIADPEISEIIELIMGGNEKPQK